MMRHSAERIPAHRKHTVSYSNRVDAMIRLMRSDFCGFCKKCQLKTEADARNYLGLLIASPNWRRRADDHTLHPYLCPHGNGWHVGHSPEVRKLLEEAKKQ